MNQYLMTCEEVRQLMLIYKGLTSRLQAASDLG